MLYWQKGSCITIFCFRILYRSRFKIECYIVNWQKRKIKIKKSLIARMLRDSFNTKTILFIVRLHHRLSLHVKQSPNLNLLLLL